MALLSSETKDKLEREIQWVFDSNKTTVTSFEIQELKLPKRNR